MVRVVILRSIYISTRMFPLFTCTAATPSIPHQHQPNTGAYNNTGIRRHRRRFLFHGGASPLFFSQAKTEAAAATTITTTMPKPPQQQLILIRGILVLVAPLLVGPGACLLPPSCKSLRRLIDTPHACQPSHTVLCAPLARMLLFRPHSTIVRLGCVHH